MFGELSWRELRRMAEQRRRERKHQDLVAVAVIAGWLFVFSLVAFIGTCEVIVWAK